MRRTSRASLQRLAVWACAGAFTVVLTGCGATPAARVAANLYLADLTGAKVSGANFASANLIGAICPNGTLAGGPSGAPPTCADLPINHSLGAP